MRILRSLAVSFRGLRGLVRGFEIDRMSRFAQSHLLRLLSRRPHLRLAIGNDVESPRIQFEDQARLEEMKNSK